MALRIKTAACLVVLGAAVCAAQDLSFNARHQHLRKGGAGTLTLTADEIRWQETGKHQQHSQTWKYSDLQRVQIEPGRARLLTYADIGWQFGRDRELVFDGLPAEFAQRVYALLIGRLDQRFVAHVAEPDFQGELEMPAKLLLGRGGASGVLKVGADRIVFDGAESRTWRYADITSVSATPPFDLTFGTIEGEQRFALKQALPEDRYNQIWRRISEFNGLKVYGTQAAHAH